MAEAGPIADPQDEEDQQPAGPEDDGEEERDAGTD